MDKLEMVILLLGIFSFILYGNLILYRKYLNIYHPLVVLSIFYINYINFMLYYVIHNTKTKNKNLLIDN